MRLTYWFVEAVFGIAFYYATSGDSIAAIVFGGAAMAACVRYLLKWTLEDLR